jgi:FMN phosphatase YigB (HAD superfamily)
LRFDVLVDSETARCYKPEPRIFHLACEALPVLADEAVMVGDIPETGIRGAHRAGVRAVWLNRGHRDWPGSLVRPDAVIDELGQLLRCVRQLT